MSSRNGSGKTPQARCFLHGGIITNSQNKKGVRTHMPYKQPLKQIVTATRGLWDIPETRTAVRDAFNKMTKCGTLALGAEVFSSGTEQKLVPHTCKGRACP